MKTLNGQSGDMTEQSANVETYWVVDVFGQNDKVKVPLCSFTFASFDTSIRTIIISARLIGDSCCPRSFNHRHLSLI